MASLAEDPDWQDFEVPDEQASELLPPKVAHALEQILIRIYGQTPPPVLVKRWGDLLQGGVSAQTFVKQIMTSKRVAATKVVPAKNPPGHHFSPVVDPDLVGDYFKMSSTVEPEDIPGIDFPLDEMVAFWERNQNFIAATPFKDEPDGVNRYNYLGGPYKYGDAITLRAMIGHYRPRRVIEIGSGYSSACMLDAADHAGMEDFELICIEPYTARLRSVLRPDDYGRRVNILERGAQGVPLDMFRELNANDILFIDSTHVMKTGSDVHYELFYILPVLKPGVIVHFHDCRFPFEYSVRQVFEKNYSWNEAYAVRALLMYSTRFRVIFYNSLFARRYPALIKQTCPDYLKNPGSALWLQVQG